MKLTYLPTDYTKIITIMGPYALKHRAPDFTTNLIYGNFQAQTA